MNYRDKNVIEVHCDESCHEVLTRETFDGKKRYFGIGAIQVDALNKQKCKNEIKEIKKAYNVPWEMKWTKLSASNFEFYKAIIDFFINSQLKFRLVRIDTVNMDMQFWHNQDPELGFFKFYYQCLKHILCENYDYRIFTDYKTNRDKKRLKTLKFFLNFYSSGNVTDIQALASQDSVFIQLADVFSGAVVASHNQSITSKAKINFCEYLAHKLGKHQLAFCSTKSSDSKFNVFCLEFGRKS